MKIIIATGGTGGHIYPALALIEEAKKRYENLDVLFIGNNDRMEAQLIPSYGYKFFGVDTSGLVGGITGKIKAINQMIKAKRVLKKVIKNFKPDVVIGFGGYVSAPAILAAQSLKIKTFIHEQNSVLGKANKIVLKNIDGVIICYDHLFEQLDRTKTKLLGNPRASQVYKMSLDVDYYNSLNLDKNKKLVLIVMGSLGSQSINELILSDVQDIKDSYQVLYVGGKNNYEQIKESYKNNSNLKVIDYVDTMKLYDKVDLIVCRAGATTMAEITTKGIPAIIIPSPYVANNHQYYNAKDLTDCGGAIMIEENQLNSKLLFSKINSIIDDNFVLETMSKNMKSKAYPNASDDILNWIEEKVI